MVKQKKSAIGIIGAVGFLVLAAGTVFNVVMKMPDLIDEIEDLFDSDLDDFWDLLWSFLFCAIGILMALALLISFVLFIRQKHSAVTALGPLLCAVSYLLELLFFSAGLIYIFSSKYYFASTVMSVLRELLCSFFFFLMFIEAVVLILSDFGGRFQKLARVVRKAFFLPVILWILTVTIIWLRRGYYYGDVGVSGGFIICDFFNLFLPYWASKCITEYVIYPLILLFPVLWAAYPYGLHKKNIAVTAPGTAGVPVQNTAGTQGYYPAGGTVPAPTPYSETAYDHGDSPDTYEMHTAAAPASPVYYPAQRPAAPGLYTPYAAYQPPPGGPAAAPMGSWQYAPAQPANNGGDTAEQIRRYKALLDEGAITADEYEAKKKQLLGL